MNRPILTDLDPLDRWIASLSPIARMLVEGSILTGCAALVIVTAVLFATANPGG